MQIAQNFSNGFLFLLPIPRREIRSEVILVAGAVVFRPVTGAAAQLQSIDILPQRFEKFSFQFDARGTAVGRPGDRKEPLLQFVGQPFEQFANELRKSNAQCPARVAKFERNRQRA